VLGAELEVLRGQHEEVEDKARVVAAVEVVEGLLVVDRVSRKADIGVEPPQAQMPLAQRGHRARYDAAEVHRRQDLLLRKLER
jgi:hypothetical protein